MRVALTADMVAAVFCLWWPGLPSCSAPRVGWVEWGGSYGPTATDGELAAQLALLGRQLITRCALGLL